MRLPVHYQKSNYRKFGYKLNGKKHLGYDFKTELNQSVYAIDSGVVIYSQDVLGFGGYYPTLTKGGVILIKHKNYISLYGHCKSNLKEGEYINENQLIGKISSYFTEFGDVPHLHFGIFNKVEIPPYPWGYDYKTGDWVDPKEFFLKRGIKID